MKKIKQMKILKILLIAGLCIGVIVPTVATNNVAYKNNTETKVIIHEFENVFAQNTNVKLKGVAVAPLAPVDVTETNIIIEESMSIQIPQIEVMSEVAKVAENAKKIEKLKQHKQIKEEKVKTEKNKIKETKETNESNKTNEVTSSNGGTISLGEFKLTAYCACSKCCGKWAGSPTASGVMPQANHTIAVDTSVIPFGTKVLINGNTYVAEDTGSGINGNKIDIYFNSHQDALNFGVQYKEVFVYD